MNDLDHMLNGKGSHHHHQEMIQQAQYIRFTDEIRTAQANKIRKARLHMVLVAIIVRFIGSL
jgi:hypothetical protein